MKNVVTSIDRRMRTNIPAYLTVLAALVFAALSMPATGQALPSADIMAAPSRLCTAESNPAYGWYELANGKQGVMTPGTTSCTSATALKFDASGLSLPLVAAVDYDLNYAPPLLPKVTVPLLEPALCEDYNPAGTVGSNNWLLILTDANSEFILGNPARGVTAVNYVLGPRALRPQYADMSVGWIRCHSGMSPNAVIEAPVEDPDAIFADGFEAGSDLRVEFLDPITDTPIANDVLHQGDTPGSLVTFKVRVKNVGNIDAHDVRIREFVPTNAALLDPVVTRTACVEDISGLNCQGVNRLAENLPQLAAGAKKEYLLTRKSSSVDSSAGQSMALIQVAVFSDPVISPDQSRSDNSRSLRILVVDQVSVTGAVSTNGQSSSAGGSINIDTPTALGKQCVVTGQTAVCPPNTSGLVFNATALSGHTFTGFTGCAGTTSNMTDSGGTFTTASAASCTVMANFYSMPTVAASVSGSNGTISPATQVIHYNTPATLTVTPSTGYEVNSINGCGGVTHVSGSTWQTAPVTSACLVSVSFKAEQYTVTVVAGPNGSVTSQNPRVITYPVQQAVFTALPDPSYEVEIASTTTCATVNGPVPNPFGSGVMFEADNVTADCQIDLTFNLITYPVTVDSNMVNGTLALDSSTVVHGQNAAFTVLPAIGYHLDGPVTGQPACGTINDNGITGTAGPITSAGCELSADFAINEYTVTVSVAPGTAAFGTIAPTGSSVGGPGPVVITPVTHGSSAEVLVFPDSGYVAHFPVNSSCQFQYYGPDSSGGQKYRASVVKDDCNISVEFLN